MQVEAIGIPHIDPVFGQHIMSFVKGLAGQGMLPPNQASTNPPIARNVPKMGELEVTMPYYILCWHL